MTYGLYTPDKRASALQNVSLETAKHYKHGEYVICKEKLVTCGFRISVIWHKEWMWGIYWFSKQYNLGWISISFNWNRYTTADEIVEK